MGMLRSATLARDLLHWSDGELRASGVGGDYATVQHLADCFADARRELEKAADVVAAAEERLLTAATEKMPPG